MKVDLLELLRLRPVVHPTTIRLLSLAGSKLVVSLKGHTWWREERGSNDASYEFHFEDLSDGLIDATLGSLVFDYENDEALEYFFVHSLADVGWAQPQTRRIFCNGALKNPLALYSKLESYLEKAEAFKRPSAFLNCGQSETPIAKFAEIASENSFLLATAPEEVCALLTAELERQGVPHNIVQCRDSRPQDRLHVRLGRSDFLCGSASAIFPD